MRAETGRASASSWCWPWPTPASASRRTSWRRSSSPSARSITAPPAPTRAPAWAWPSAAGWPSAMGGDIELDSALGEGSTVTVRLPLERAATRRRTRSRPPTRRSELADCRLLICDANPLSQAVIKAMLQPAGPRRGGRRLLRGAAEAAAGAAASTWCWSTPARWATNARPGSRPLREPRRRRVAPAAGRGDDRRHRRGRGGPPAGRRRGPDHPQADRRPGPGRRAPRRASTRARPRRDAGPPRRFPPADQCSLKL